MAFKRQYARPRVKKTPHRRVSKGTKRSTRRRFRASTPGSIRLDVYPSSAGQPNGALVMRLPKKVRSLNRLKTGLARHGDTKAWESAILRLGALTTEGDDAKAILWAMTVDGRRRLEIERQAPTEHYYLDQTNFAGGVKGLEDALVRLGYLVDDSLKWLDGPHIHQSVSADKKFWTIVRISLA